MFFTFIFLLKKSKVILDEHHSMEEKLIKIIGTEIKIVIKIIETFCTEPDSYLIRKSIKTIQFLYIYSCLNHANIAWATTYFMKVKGIHY